MRREVAGFSPSPMSGELVVTPVLPYSAVDPVMALNDLIAASRAVQANATMMQHHNTILGEAINTFGRVA